MKNFHRKCDCSPFSLLVWLSLVSCRFGFAVAEVYYNCDDYSVGMSGEVCLSNSSAIHDIRVSISGDDCLPIHSIQQMVRIDGSHARVIVDAVVEYPYDPCATSRTSEGTFLMELPTGASPFFVGFGVEHTAPQSLFLDYSGRVNGNWTSEELQDLRREKHSPSFKAARMAGKATAAQSFTEIVNRGVDPAIVEQGSAGSFSTRLFPFFRGKLHRITLGYDVPMEFLPSNHHNHNETNETNQLRYDLFVPSSVPWEPEIRVEMVANQEPIFLDERAEYSTEEGLPVHIELLRNKTDAPENVRNYTIEFERQPPLHRDFINVDVDVDIDVSVNVETMDNSDSSKSTESSMLLEAAPLSWGIVDGIHHFETRFRIPELLVDGDGDDDDDEGNSQITTERTLYNVVFCIETSFTTAQETGAMDRYKEIVTAVLENDPSIGLFNILAFDIGVQWLAPPRGDSGLWLPNDEESRQFAMEFLDSILLEGATDLRMVLSELIDRRQQMFDQPFDVFLMSSATVTWGESDPNRIVAVLSSSGSDDADDALLLPRRVHTYHVGSSGGDPTLLRRLANARGGVFTSISDPSKPVLDPEKALTQHLLPRIALESVSVEGALDVVVAGGLPGNKNGDAPLLMVRPGQNVRVAWRASSPDARTIKVGFLDDDNNNNNNGTTMEPISVTLPLPMLPTNVGVRAYGILANAALEELLPLSEDMARSVALYYRVVGQTASLIMLETEAQYEEFGIIESHPFSSVRDINPAKSIQELSEEATRVARSAFQGLLDFIRKIQATGVKLSFPDDVSTLLFEKGLSDASVDVASRARKDSTFDRTKTTRLSGALRSELEDNSEASYDSWTAESDIRKKNGSSFGALRALTSLLAQQPGDFVLRRDVALSSIELGYPAGAFYAFEHVAETRPWEPMSYIQMAQTAQTSGLPDLALVLFEVALAGAWEHRFSAFRDVSGMLYARHLRQVNDGTAVSSEESVKEFAANREPDIRAWFSAAEEASLVVFMTWNQDRTDIDLHVTEPNGEECYYGNTDTKSGGRLFGDVTDGYGPELYVQSNLNERGEYEIDVKVYSVNQNRLSAPIKVLVEVFTDWGFSNENYSAHTTVGRDSDSGLIRVATVTLEDPDGEPIKLPVGDLTIPQLPIFNSEPPIIGINGIAAVDDSNDDLSVAFGDGPSANVMSAAESMRFASFLFVLLLLLSLFLTSALAFGVRKD